MVRLAWHDSGTYDQRIKNFPERGGANGAIRFAGEMNFGANAGLDKSQRVSRRVREEVSRNFLG